MTELSPNPEPAARRSLWKPIGITLLVTFLLGFSTCAGGLAMSNKSSSLSGFLIYAGLMFLGLFSLTLFIAMIYFLGWLIGKLGSK